MGIEFEDIKEFAIDYTGGMFYIIEDSSSFLIKADLLTFSEDGTLWLYSSFMVADEIILADDSKE